MGWRDRIRKRVREATEKVRKETERRKKVVLEKKEVELKKEPAKRVNPEREKVEKAMARLRVFVPGVPPVCSTETGKPILEVYSQNDFYRDIQTVLHYLMNKEDK